MVARGATEIRGRGTRTGWVPAWRWVTAAAFATAVVVGGMALAPEPLARRLGSRLLSAMSIAGSIPHMATVPPSHEQDVTPPVTAVGGPLPTLVQVLADPAVRTDEASAFTALYARWGLDQPGAKGRQVCDGGWDAGLRCLPRTGSWATLRRYALQLSSGWTRRPTGAAYP